MSKLEVEDHIYTFPEHQLADTPNTRLAVGGFPRPIVRGLVLNGQLVH